MLDVTVPPESIPEAPDFVFGEQTDDANRYATLVGGRRLTISFPRHHTETDPGRATWHAWWEDELRAGVTRAFDGEVAFKHHITTLDVEGVVRHAAAVAPAALPGIERPA